MSVITLRGLNPEAEKTARRNASSKGKSMNRFIIELIENSVLGKNSGKPHEYDDLDELIGSMTEEDAQNIVKSSSDQRKIDSGLWL